jgi:hypothetical protein
MAREVLKKVRRAMSGCTAFTIRRLAIAIGGLEMWLINETVLMTDDEGQTPSSCSFLVV